MGENVTESLSLTAEWFMLFLANLGGAFDVFLFVCNLTIAVVTLAMVCSAAVNGIEAYGVEVEVRWRSIPLSEGQGSVIMTDPFLNFFVR